jgi:hypothetical protein
VKYTCEIDIALPRPRVIELFDSAENLAKWMEGLKRFTPLEGPPGQPGSTAELEFDFKGKPMLMIETVTERRLPEVFAGSYQTDGVFNTVRNIFTEHGTGTRWTQECEFQFRGFVMRTVGFLMPGAFRKQTLKYMQAFKAFAEAAS